jgi:hypothetical protein
VIRVLDAYNPPEAVVVPVPVELPVVLVPVELPVPVPVPVPVEAPVVLVPVAVDTFCNTPRSISEPLLRTIPCKVVAVVLVPKASVKVTVIVQSEFRI